MANILSTQLFGNDILSKFLAFRPYYELRSFIEKTKLGA